MPSIVIIAAMKQEVLPLLHDSAFSWKANPRVRAHGAWFTERAAVICGGIGGKHAASITEQALREFSPRLVISAGLAGALAPGFHVADVIKPATVVNSSTGVRYQVTGGRGVLVTASGVAGEEGKRLLARHFGADAADMEAASVAEVAERHGVLFAAIKSISDEYDFQMPDLNGFIGEDGRFETRRFGIFVATHPRIWPVVRQLARNSRLASVELCRELRNLILQDPTNNEAESAGRPRESQPAQ
jgi:adenosylhomocysteine nucleosidase